MKQTNRNNPPAGRSRLRGMAAGFLAGGGLILAGVALQILAGPVDWDFFTSPVNRIAMVLLSALIGVIFILRRDVPAFEWMMHYGAAVPCLCYAAGLTLLMGLTVQTPEGGIPWISRMLSFWPFVLIWTWMAFISGLAALNHLMRLKWREIPFVVNHLGVFLAITCATLGSADVQELRMTVYQGRPEWRATDGNGREREPGLSIDLHRFIAEYYEDGTPRRFASEISVQAQDGTNAAGTVEVNRPLKVNGWKIYQYGYDVQLGAESPYSVFQLVKDPWLPAVYLGIFMMLSGAVCLMLFMAPKTKKV